MLDSRSVKHLQEQTCTLCVETTAAYRVGALDRRNLSNSCHLLRHLILGCLLGGSPPLNECLRDLLQPQHFLAHFIFSSINKRELQQLIIVT